MCSSQPDALQKAARKFYEKGKHQDESVNRMKSLQGNHLQEIR